MTATLPRPAQHGQPEPVDRLKADLIDVIETAIIEHPRSQQAEIGVSEYGVECVRKLGLKIAQAPRARPEAPAWRPTVGTAVHTWLEATFRAENAKLGWDRYLVDTRVTVGDIDSKPLRGTGDLFDLLTGTVVDWKVPGVTTIRQAKKDKHPGRQYQVQAHGYGAGYALLGFDVRHVAIMYLPAAGDLVDAYLWTEPFDPTIVDQALARATAVASAIRTVGAEQVIPYLPIAEDHCAHCPWWMPNAFGAVWNECAGALPTAAPPTDPFGGRR